MKGVRVPIFRTNEVLTLTLQTYSEEKRARVRPPQAEYFTVREILAEASTAADGVL